MPACRPASRIVAPSGTVTCIESMITSHHALLSTLIGFLITAQAPLGLPLGKPSVQHDSTS